MWSRGLLPVNGKGVLRRKDGNDKIKMFESNEGYCAGVRADAGEEARRRRVKMDILDFVMLLGGVLYERRRDGDPLTLGVLGGLGPAASAYFLEMITEHMKAQRDQDHIDILLSSRASTPDRTDFIMGRSSADPLPVMIRDAKYLESCNVSAIVIPCNTAHYFIDEIRRSVSVPMPSIITETVEHIKHAGYRKAGILATEGTLKANSYQLECEREGIAWEIPSEESQRALMELIYGSVKSGKPVDLDRFEAICRELTDKGCDTLILGCTELSLINKQLGGDSRFTDSLEVLAYTAIKLCGHAVCGFGSDFPE